MDAVVLCLGRLRGLRRRWRRSRCWVLSRDRARSRVLPRFEGKIFVIEGKKRFSASPDVGETGLEWAETRCEGFSLVHRPCGGTGFVRRSTAAPCAPVSAPPLGQHLDRKSVV